MNINVCDLTKFTIIGTVTSSTASNGNTLGLQPSTVTRTKSLGSFMVRYWDHCEATSVTIKLDGTTFTTQPANGYGCGAIDCIKTWIKLIFMVNWGRI